MRVALTARAATIAARARGARAATRNPQPPKLPASLRRSRAVSPSSPTMAATAPSNCRYTGQTTGSRRAAPTRRAS
eukprot:773862-Lingulodinium_polyedra.AAC.1